MTQPDSLDDLDAQVSQSVRLLRTTLPPVSSPSATGYALVEALTGDPHQAGQSAGPKSSAGLIEERGPPSSGDPCFVGAVPASESKGSIMPGQLG